MASPRVWFVTGSSTGFGRLLTERALSKGDKVVATLRQPEAISDIAAKYSKDQLLVLKLDVTNREDVTASFDKAKETFGRIDVVFSNAGWGIIGEVEATDEQKARDQFEVNFWGASYVAKEAVKAFRDTNKPVGGKLLHMSSMFGIAAAPGAGWYSATKFAGDALIEALNQELDPEWKIKIVILCPGWFKTPMVMTNPIVSPAHEAYTKNTLPSNQVREAFKPMQTGESPLLGDPTKLIKNIYEVSTLEDVPLYVPFGADARACFERRVASLTEGLEKTKQWSADLAFD